MWKKPGPPVAIDASQVIVGMYVWLELSWDEHPFICNRLMVKSDKDVSIIQSLNTLGRIHYYPDKSTVDAPAYVPPSPTTEEIQAAKNAEKAAMAAEVKRLDAEKKEQRQRQKDAAARADRAWESAARTTREALLNLTRSPKAAGEQLSTLARETAATISQSQEILLHLLGDKKEQGPQFHALNVMTLCMLVGKKAMLSQRELADLAMASFAHDAGKSKVPPNILKTNQRKKHEEEFFRQHVMYSVQFAAQSGAFSREALNIIANHHEAVDGSGWPKGKNDAGVAARILAVVDRYDRLCSPEALDVEPLMPAEALAHMFRHEASKFDTGLLSLLIKLLGVYPPGTVVQLSDGSLAMVVAAGPNSLQPQVLLYAPELPKDDAPIMDLVDEPSLKITEAIRPGTLPPDVLKWLNPQKRLSYFFSVKDGKS